MWKSRKVKQLERDLAEAKAEAHENWMTFVRKNNEWNKLVRIINEKGGQRFLETAILPEHISGHRHLPATAFEKKDIRRLKQLCHPDKHNNSTLSQEVTAWLNSL